LLDRVSEKDSRRHVHFAIYDRFRIIDLGREYYIKSAGRTGYKWVRASRCFVPAYDFAGRRF